MAKAIISGAKYFSPGPYFSINLAIILTAECFDDDGLCIDPDEFQSYSNRVIEKICSYIRKDKYLCLNIDTLPDMLQEHIEKKINKIPKVFFVSGGEESMNDDHIYVNIVHGIGDGFSVREIAKYCNIIPQRSNFYLGPLRYFRVDSNEYVNCINLLAGTVTRRHTRSVYKELLRRYI